MNGPTMADFWLGCQIGAAFGVFMFSRLLYLKWKIEGKL